LSEGALLPAKTNWLWKVVIFFVCACIPLEVHAEAFRILNQGAAAAGQAGAFAAQADDPSAIHYNPAGMTQLSRVQVYLGTSLIGGSTTFKSPTGLDATGDLGGSVAIPPPPTLFITANLKDLGLDWLGETTVGLGLTSPYGLNVRYPDDGPFSTAVTSATLPLIDIKPTIAYRLNDKLSFGFGADIYTFADFVGSGHLELKQNAPPGLGVPVGTPLELNGNDTAAGFNVSMMYTPYRNEKRKPLVNIGFQYRSQATLHLQGEFRANGALVANTRSSLVLPQIFTGAIAVWPIRDDSHEWKLEFDVDYVGWKSNRNLNIDLSTGGTLPFPQNWRNNFVLYLGTEYKWLEVKRLPNWEAALRAGYWRSQTPVPDATFNPTVPDSDNHNISIGLGVFCRNSARFLGLIPCGSGRFVDTNAMGLDVAYQALIYETRTITGNINPTVNGSYNTLLHVGIISFRLNF
jgi:long-chain fatty acid transport protein